MSWGGGVLAVVQCVRNERRGGPLATRTLRRQIQERRQVECILYFKQGTTIWMGKQMRHGLSCLDYMQQQGKILLSVRNVDCGGGGGDGGDDYIIGGGGGGVVVVYAKGGGGRTDEEWKFLASSSPPHLRRPQEGRRGGGVLYFFGEATPPRHQASTAAGAAHRATAPAA